METRRPDRQESMRIIGKMDCTLEASVVMGYFGMLGFSKMRVMVDNERGTVEVTLLEGRIWPLRKWEKIAFNKLKCWGVCYTVQRVVHGIKIWDSKNWDVD